MTQYKPGELSSLFGIKDAIVYEKKEKELPSKKDDIVMNNNNSSNESSTKFQRNMGNDQHIFQPKIKIKVQKTFWNDKENKKNKKHNKNDNDYAKYNEVKKNKKKIATLTPKELEYRNQMTERTLFIGNIPLYWNKQNIIHLLDKWKDNVEDIFFSNYISRKILSKHKLSEIQEINKNVPSKNAWIRFKEKKFVDEAISLNNAVVDQTHTLRVDYGNQNKKRIFENCVFVGGLPLDCNEDDIREHFQQCDTIVNIRILRDQKTQLSKGCGFVEFDSIHGVHKALDLHLSNFKGKKEGKVVRVIPWLSNIAQANPNVDSEKQHLKQILRTRPHQLKTKNAGVLIRFDENTKTKLPDKKNKKMMDNEKAKYYHKGRDEFMNKLRWRDHPELKMKALKNKQLKLKVNETVLNEIETKKKKIINQQYNRIKKLNHQKYLKKRREMRERFNEAKNDTNNDENNDNHDSNDNNGKQKKKNKKDSNEEALKYFGSSFDKEELGDAYGFDENSNDDGDDDPRTW